MKIRESLSVLIPLTLVAFFVAVIALPVAVQAKMDKVSYKAAKPYLKLLESSAKNSSDLTINVKSHSDKIGEFDPSSLQSLTDFVLTMAEQASSGKGTLYDEKFQVINDRLSLCLGGKYPGKSDISRIIFCQDFKTNRLNKLVVKNTDGGIAGEYILQFN